MYFPLLAIGILPMWNRYIIAYFDGRGEDFCLVLFTNNSKCDTIILSHKFNIDFSKVFFLRDNYTFFLRSFQAVLHR